MTTEGKVRGKIQLNVTLVKPQCKAGMEKVCERGWYTGECPTNIGRTNKMSAQQVTKCVQCVAQKLVYEK